LTTKKTMRITIETQSQLVIHLGSARVWCEHRLSEKEMLCLQSAAELEVKAVRALVNNERLQSSHGPVWVYLNSFLKRLKRLGDMKSLHRHVSNRDLEEQS
jgi:hypothetical protein